MTDAASSALLGAISMASLVTALLFARFWRQTRDEFFLFFSIAFLIDAISRFGLATVSAAQEFEPLYYMSRLITFGLIIVAVIRKNQTKKK